MQNVQEGEASVLQELLDFLLILIAGSGQKRKRKIQNVFFIYSPTVKLSYMLFTMEKIKMLRRIMLETSLKSLKNIGKNIDVIHLYGHCISYTGIEEK